MNAVKHGMTARTPVLPGEDADAYRGRLDSWAEALAPADAVEQFLVEQAATASWKIDRADRIEAARLFDALRAAEDEQRAGRRKEADRLGRLLLGLDGRAADPALAQEVLRILDPGNPAPPADRLAPLRPIVARLESTAEGCTWLLERWAEFRAPLERGTDWDEDRFVRAVRLSGRQPLNLTPEAWELRGQSRCFLSAEPVEPSGDAELDEERQEALDAAICREFEAEDRRALARQLVEDMPEDESEARSALLVLVERAIGRLTAMASAHEARWEAGAVERAERMTFEPGPDDELLWRYQIGCGRSMQRMLDTLLKVRREDRAAGRAAGGAKEATVHGPATGDVEGRPAAPPAVPARADARAVADRPCSQVDAGVPVIAQPPPRDEATAPANPTDPEATAEVSSGVCDAGRSVRPGSSQPAVSPTEGPPIQEDATNEPTAPALIESGSPAPTATEGHLSVFTDHRPLTTDHSPQTNEVTKPTVDHPDPQHRATAPEVGQPPLRNEANAPSRGAGRPRPAVLVTALALVFLSTGLAPALGGSADHPGPLQPLRQVGVRRHPVPLSPAFSTEKFSDFLENLYSTMSHEFASRNVVNPDIGAFKKLQTRYILLVGGQQRNVEQRGAAEMSSEGINGTGGETDVAS